MKLTVQNLWFYVVQKSRGVNIYAVVDVSIAFVTLFERTCKEI